MPNNGLQSGAPSQLANLLSIRGYTHYYPNEYNMQHGVSLSRELPGEINLTVGYTGSQGKDMFLRGVGNTLNINTRAAWCRPTVRSTTRPLGASMADDFRLSGERLRLRDV